MLFFPIAATAQIQEAHLCGWWKYEFIHSPDGQPAKRVGPADRLILRIDSGSHTFKYDLALEGIHASGQWKLTDSLLVFTYTPYSGKGNEIAADMPAIRTFKIQRRDSRQLLFQEVLREGIPGLSFSFRFFSE